MNFNSSNNKVNVQATDESCSSVKQLSSWIAANPTASEVQSPGGSVRNGKNVVLKSRKFEKVTMDGLAGSHDIEVGSVQSKQAWLESAFGSHNCVDEKVKLMSGRNTTAKMTCDRLSTIDQKRDDNPELASISKNRYADCERKSGSNSNAVDENAAPIKEIRNREPKKGHADQSTQAIANAPTVDFRAARQLLIQRSVANGTAVELPTKVQMRTRAFEQIVKDEKKKCDPYGMMKRTWRSARPSEGPSNGYKRELVGEVARKKTLAELP